MSRLRELHDHSAPSSSGRSVRQSCIGRDFEFDEATGAPIPGFTVTLDASLADTARAAWQAPLTAPTNPWEQFVSIRGLSGSPSTRVPATPAAIRAMFRFTETLRGRAAAAPGIDASLIRALIEQSPRVKELEEQVSRLTREVEQLRRVRSSDDEETECVVPPDEFATWVEAHLDDLRKYPNEFVAFSPRTGIVDHDPDGEALHRRLWERRSEVVDYCVEHTSLYL